MLNEDEIQVIREKCICYCKKFEIGSADDKNPHDENEEARRIRLSAKYKISLEEYDVFSDGMFRAGLEGIEVAIGKADFQRGRCKNKDDAKTFLLSYCQWYAKQYMRRFFANRFPPLCVLRIPIHN